ncbi:type II toxin-antitoxin system VapC family toxin [Leptospira alstonii]|uniref:PIN domain protein n=2 Tax=Leptospira alstonii TaxID=28452 RepID=M6D6G7_9LEPT|nr:type II toxin-antitoxin system VapC family toxin [Leptospira alstonii]EMJ96838.1 PIN domain protein [Leptospira alstonii serovar Sichuan str. 79601]EQA80016.1 PIN domain protein [Leptospira alstonii serovar Pingchang str. 80-412]
MILLDTHAFVWLMEGDAKITKNKKLVGLIEKNIPTQTIFVSEISAWEIAMLESKGRIKLNEPIEDWLEQAFSAPGIKSINLTPKIIVDSVNLPGKFHADPSDRLIVSTSRLLGAELITADKEIIRYSKSGYLKVFRFV